MKVGHGAKLFAYVFLDPKDPPKTVMLQFYDGTWEHRAVWGEDLILWGTQGKESRLPMGRCRRQGNGFGWRSRLRGSACTPGRT